jgi:hypothetical protein
MSAAEARSLMTDAVQIEAAALVAAVLAGVAVSTALMMQPSAASLSIIEAGDEYEEDED